MLPALFCLYERQKWEWWRMPVIPATQEAERGGSRSKAYLGKSSRPYLKKVKVKNTGIVAQLVEHLPSKCKALSSNP
jgi:hypothetical protein